MILRRAAPLAPAVAAAFLAAACSVNADWPKLSDPLPDAAERTTKYKDPNARPREVGMPAAPEAEGNAPPESPAEAATRFAEVQADYAKAFAAYADVRDSIGKAADKDVAGDRWREAQLLLTRASFVRERLMPLMALSEDAVRLFESSDKVIAAERLKLDSLQP